MEHIVKRLLKLKFTVSPVRDDYIIAKLKIFKNVNMTTFTNNVIPIEKTHYTCISAIDIDSVLKIDKKVFPQAYLEQCKYKLKKKKCSRYIDHPEIIDEDDDYKIIDDKNDNKSDDGYPNYYGRIINFKKYFILLVIIKEYNYF